MYNELFELTNRESFAFSAENPSGKRGGGSRGGDCSKLSPNVLIPKGQSVVLVDTDGPGIIQSMWFTGYVGHNFILRIYWDGCEHPSVEAPLSAFFGCAYDETFKDRDGNYPVLNSAVMMVAPGRGFNSYFPMPFAKHCKITVENRSSVDDRRLFYMITGCYTELPENIVYFHASYRQAHPVTKGKSYTVIDGIKGRGHFVGVTLAAGINGHNTCWVEGEAKMYIDGDIYPSINYTGTEDYFCGSYAFGKDIANHQYQTFSGHQSGMFSVLGSHEDGIKGYNYQQRFLLYRFHVSDPIYFKESFRMTLDNLGWTGPRYDDYTTVAYWYQTLPCAPLPALPTDGDCTMR